MGDMLFIDLWGATICVEVPPPCRRRHDRAPAIWPDRISICFSWSMLEMPRLKNDLTDRPRVLVFGDSSTDYVLGLYRLHETF